MKEDIKSDIHLPYPLFDSHFHALHMVEKGLDIGDLIPELFSRGLDGAMEVAVDEFNFDKRLSIANSFKGIQLSAGIHPSSSGEDKGNWSDRFQIVAKQIENPAVRAIGETGLDFFREFVPRKRQIEAFRSHLNLAAESGLPIIIHNRDADETILKIIRESKCRYGVFHCFSSDWELAKEALKLGFHISFAGNITYKKNDSIRDAALKIPSDRLLLETDSPYLSPQKVRGRTNHPGQLGYTLEFLAHLRGDDIEELAAETVENSIRLFEGLKT
ncbi:MAG: TatD family hydrolase [Spirochaetaceae bacterium]|nr:TatD family hydrolase [Spirochaetaceae bacterium]